MRALPHRYKTEALRRHYSDISLSHALRPAKPRRKPSPRKLEPHEVIAKLKARKVSA